MKTKGRGSRMLRLMSGISGVKVGRTLWKDGGWAMCVREGGDDDGEFNVSWQ